MAFGGVWKASLTELSGGQRSLLALSLILAMLLFKPAPIYILDEARTPCAGGPVCCTITDIVCGSPLQSFVQETLEVLRLMTSCSFA